MLCTLGYKKYVSKGVSIISGYPPSEKKRVIEVESPDEVVWTPGLIEPSQNTTVVKRGETVVLKMKLGSLKSHNDVVVYSCPVLKNQDYCSVVELAALKGEVVDCFPKGIEVRINSKPYLKLNLVANRTVDINVEISVGENVEPRVYAVAVGVTAQMPWK